MLFTKKTFVPDFITSDRVAAWEASQPTPPKFSFARVLCHEASNSCDWLKLYCLRYAATKGFTRPGVLRYDLSGEGEFYATPSAGCRAALAVEKKSKETERPLPEDAAKIFAQVWAFCKDQQVAVSARKPFLGGLGGATRATAPESVTPQKILDFEEVTPLREGITSLTYMKELATQKKANWALFYAWCYVRTRGFRDPCMARRDIGNSGKTFETLQEGVKDAVRAFLQYPHPAAMDEGPEVVETYERLLKYCETAVYDSPAATDDTIAAVETPLLAPPPPQPMERQSQLPVKQIVGVVIVVVAIFACLFLISRCAH